MALATCHTGCEGYDNVPSNKISREGIPLLQESVDCRWWATRTAMENGDGDGGIISPNHA